MKRLLVPFASLILLLCSSGAQSRRITSERDLRRALIAEDHEAIFQNKEHILNDILTLSVCESDIHGRDQDIPQYEAFIKYAAMVGDGFLARRCIDLGFGVNQPLDNLEGTFLTYPHVMANAPFLEFLLDRGLNVNQDPQDRDNVVCTIVEELHLCEDKQDVSNFHKALKLIVSRSDSPEFICEDGRSALLNALSLRQREAASILLENGPPTQMRSENALQALSILRAAVAHGSDRGLADRLTLEMCESDIQGRDKSHPLYTAFVIYAALTDDGWLAQRCLDLGFGLYQAVDGNGATFLEYPQILFNLPVLKILLDRGLDPSEPVYDGDNVICMIVEGYSLLESPKDKARVLEAIEMIMLYAPTPDMRCTDGKTVLYHAMQLKIPEIVAILLNNNAQLASSTDEEKHTPLYYIKTQVLTDKSNPDIHRIAGLVHAREMQRQRAYVRR